MASTSLPRSFRTMPFIVSFGPRFVR
ncbi:hypothetical protein CGRA01v4_04198 [Colletotrichum graminicola]|nr:hypothetical protein CGRA01v4_04198 [Colletotrichum graminicola]